MWLHRAARSNVVNHAESIDGSANLFEIGAIRNRILICFVKTYTIVQERHAVRACRNEV